MFYCVRYTQYCVLYTQMSKRGKRRSGGTPALPASHQKAWGVARSDRRDRKPALSLRQIVNAAVSVAAVRRPGRGVDGPGGRRARRRDDVALSLRRREGRAAGAHDGRGSSRCRPRRPSRERAGAARCRAGRARTSHVLRRHPWVVRIPLSGPPVLPNQMVWFERGLACLAKTGLTEARQALGPAPGQRFHPERGAADLGPPAERARCRCGRRSRDGVVRPAARAARRRAAVPRHQRAAGRGSLRGPGGDRRRVRVRPRADPRRREGTDAPRAELVLIRLSATLHAPLV